MTAAVPPSEADGEERFWSLAQPLLMRPDVASSTMMGLPCLRARGHFFASADPRTGHLLVKLSEARVTQTRAAARIARATPIKVQ